MKYEPNWYEAHRGRYILFADVVGEEKAENSIFVRGATIETVSPRGYVQLCYSNHQGIHFEWVKASYLNVVDVLPASVEAA
jgi:hypothetical protein